MRPSTAFFYCILLLGGCTSAKYSISYDDAARLPKAELKRIALICTGGYKTGFLKSFTQYVTANFNYRGYKCTGIYHDSLSFETRGNITAHIEALKPDMTVQLYAITDTAERKGYDIQFRNANIYRIDVWRGWGSGRQQVAKGTATVHNDSDVSGADFRRIASELCLELLRGCTLRTPTS